MPSGAKWHVSLDPYRPLLCHSYDLIFHLPYVHFEETTKKDRGLDQYFPKRLVISKPVRI